ncbi:hypothetical protein [Mangrovicoccus algicola]|uniref:Sialate O-acetylesterase domain-containing protein n=1 Tax=Mangrovicoccus algicola TaxID=2771008 RepID=A0A8J6YTC6_9RHOB|nr:hypothetical protein [Mangrovicoccus algicola]MBE3637457.1 hypothetical protein [Mangrovicoccus algicola]
MTTIRIGGGPKGEPGKDALEVVNERRAAENLPPVTEDELYEQIVNPQLTAEAQQILTGAEDAKGGAEVAQGAAEVARDEAQTYAMNALDTSKLALNWANLLSMTGEYNGQAATVLLETGGHLQATATGYDGAPVADAGQYQWQANWARWKWLSDSKDVLFAAAVEGARKATAMTTGTGAAYAVAMGKMPSGNQLLSVQFHAASTSTAPTLTITAGGVTSAPSTLRGPDNTVLREPLEAGTRYLIDYGTGTSRVLTAISPALSARLEAIEAALAGGGGGGGPDLTDEVQALEDRAGYAEARAVSPWLAQMARAGIAVPGNENPAAQYVRTKQRPYQFSPWFPGQAIASASPPTRIDLTHMAVGSSAEIFLRSGDVLYAGVGVSFFGQPAVAAPLSGTVTATGLSAVRLRRWPAGISVQLVDGASLTHGSAALSWDHLIACGGQSNMEGMFTKFGVGGIAYGVAEMIAAPQDLSLRITDGATGGTAIDKRSVPVGLNAYWWDALANGGLGAPGPALTTFMNAVAADAALTGITPTITLWTQGESDAQALQDGALTPAQMTASILATFGHIRASWPDMVFICNMIGSHDLRTVDRGANAARVAYLDAIAAAPGYVKQGIEYYDLPREQNNIHYETMAYPIAGVRMAKAWANEVLGQANPLGPRVTAAVLADAHTVRLTVDWGGNAFVPPVPLLRHTRPYGIYAQPAGSDALADTIDLETASIDSSGRIVLTSAADLTGCVIGGPYGYAEHAARGQILRDYHGDAAHHWPGQPLRSFRMTVA